MRITIVVLITASFFANAPAAEIARPLKLGKTMESAIKPGESQVYSLKLKKGQYMRIVLTRPDLTTAVRLRSATGNENLVELNFPAEAARRTEALSWIAASSGKYRIEVSAPSSAGSPERYQVKLAERRRAVAQDHKVLEIQRLSDQARSAEVKREYRDSTALWDRALALTREVNDRNDESWALRSAGAGYLLLNELDKARSDAGQALAIFREIHDRYGEASSLCDLGVFYGMSSQLAKGVDSLDQALAIFGELGDRRGSARAEMGLGTSYFNLGQQDKAIEHYERAVTMMRAVGDRRSEGLALNNLGNSYSNLGQHEKSIAYYEQALAIARERKDRHDEGLVIGNIGLVHAALGQYEKAVGEFEESLALMRETKDRRAEANALGNLALAYGRFSQFEKALDYAGRSQAIRRELGDRRGEAIGLNSLGVYYEDLGQYEKALDFYQQSLTLSRQVQARLLEARALNNIGTIHLELMQASQSVPYLEQALAIRREISDRQGEASTLGNLGLAYGQMSQFPKAIDFNLRALAIDREVQDRQAEGRRLSFLAYDYRNLGQSQTAISDYQQAVAILREVGDRFNESQALEGLMDAWSAAGNPRMAIFYGKQAVNTTQSIRSDNQGLARDLQSTFLKSNETRYHTLAELLIAEGRLAEAEQVLALLKEEEYFQYVRRAAEEASSVNGRAGLTADEVDWQKRYDQIGGQLMAIGAERGALLAKKTRTPEEMQRLTALDRDISAGNQKFQQFLGELAQHFSAKVDAGRRIEDIQETQGIMEDLRELPQGTVAIYTLAAQDKFYAILRTPDAQKAYEYPITAAELNRKIADFRQAVEDPRIDPRPLGQELYRILVGGMAEDLRQAGAKTLMWSLDGAVRYVPLAALYDGKQYLIEQYRLSVITLASRSRLKDRPDREWRAAGMGVTKPYQDAPALPFVSSELAAIISTRPGDAGVMQGEIRLDGDFTEDAMKQELLKRFPVVHIASHFRFQPGDDSKSFLLLGDGGHFSLAELKTSANLFGGVQLLTLSACNTGVGDGTEVEGFGTLAQRQGAKAVIASLWAVMDESTSRLMQRFYRIRESSPEMTKLEALREAQLELLHNGGPSAGGPARGVSLHPEGKSNAPEFTPDPGAPFSHPYYWAPFFLMGNWL